MPFDGSKPGPGRPKGSENKATKDFKEWAEKFFSSPKWRKSAEQRMVEGKAPHLETYALALLCGKPTDKVEHSGAGGGPMKIIFGGRYKPNGSRSGE